jgi:hypothetical protein
MSTALTRFALAVSGLGAVFCYLAADGGRMPPPGMGATRPLEVTQASYFSPLLVAEDIAAPPPAATVRRTAAVDLQTQRDLFALFRRLSHADNPLDLKQAAAILDRCDAPGAPRPARGDDAHYAARTLAASELAQRCQGFRQAPGAEVESHRQALRSRLADQGLDPLAGAQAGNALLAAPVLRSLLRDNDPATFEEARPALTRAMAGKLGFAEETPAWDDLQTALLLATCTLGASCSRDSFDALRQCAYQDRCGGGQFDQWQEGLAPERTARVARLRAMVLQAVQAQDFRALGVD